jgi:hypothetical protein
MGSINPATCRLANPPQFGSVGFISNVGYVESPHVCRQKGFGETTEPAVGPERCLHPNR